MLKKTRKEKPDAKNNSQDIPLNLPTTSSRPHTPSNFTKHESGKSGSNKKQTTENKVAGS